MKKRWCLATIIALTTVLPAFAETPSGTLRVFVSSANPTGDWSGDIDIGFSTVNGTVEADTTAGFGILYEVRLGDRIGVESGIYFADFDFDIEVSGVSTEFGSALAIPLTLGLDFHPPVGERVDFYVGPLISYTLWGDLDTPVGVAPIDGDFGFGAVAGLDVPLGKSGWIFNAGLRYLTMAASDASAEIDVNPLFAELGFGFRF